MIKAVIHRQAATIVLLAPLIACTPPTTIMAFLVFRFTTISIGARNMRSWTLSFMHCNNGFVIILSDGTHQNTDKPDSMHILRP